MGFGPDLTHQQYWMGTRIPEQDLLDTSSRYRPSPGGDHEDNAGSLEPALSNVCDYSLPHAMPQAPSEIFLPFRLTTQLWLCN